MSIILQIIYIFNCSVTPLMHVYVDLHKSRRLFHAWLAVAQVIIKPCHSSIAVLSMAEY